MTVTASDFLERYPNFNTTSEDLIDTILAESYVDLDSITNEAKQDQLAMLATAHNLELERRNALGVGLILKTMESDKRLFDEDKINDREYWDLTHYGKKYMIEYQKASSSIGMFVV